MKNSAEPYYAFPLHPIIPANETYTRRSEASVVELADGDCLVAYANHTGHSDNDRAYIGGMRLSREGRATGEERVLVEAPAGGLNAMSPALKRLPDGRIGLLYSYRMSVTEAERHFVFSEDEGATWSKPAIVGTGQYKTGCHDRFTVLSTGRYIAPLHCTDDWHRHYLHVRVARSDNGGGSWSLSGGVALPYIPWDKWVADGESGCMEPAVAERGDGSLLMTLRTGMGTQFCTESFDGGETWTQPRTMEVISPLAPAHLSRIPGTQHLLLLWTPDYEPTARLGGERHTIMACVSKDGGRSWPHDKRKVLVRDGEHSVDYPSVLYKGGEAWITLRTSSKPQILGGWTSTSLMKVPLAWFWGA